MTVTDLPYRASTAQCCAWLEQQTKSAWSLARLLEHGLIPHVWLDYDASYPELFGEANGGFPAPIMFEQDTQRLAAGSADVLITFTKDADKIPVQLAAPGIRRPLSDLRFYKKEIVRLLHALNKPPEAEKTVPAKSKVAQPGINREQVLSAFAAMLKINLDQALTSEIGVFGDEGAKIKGNARGSKKNALWNPVTLALGLNDSYRVPMARLTRAFEEQDCLLEWRENWLQSLDLLGE